MSYKIPDNFTMPPNQTIETDGKGVTYVYLTPLTCIAEMVKEHFDLTGSNILIGTDIPITYMIRDKYDGGLIIYNWEHFYPMNRGVNWWIQDYQKSMDVVDEIWDFNIENYKYFQEIGHGDKFRFIPPRYTTWFEQFRMNLNKDFDIFFTGVFNSDLRKKAIECLTYDIDITANTIPFKLCNTNNISLRYKEMQTSKYTIDLPHFDTPQTINGLRIFESICLNIPVIVFDKYDLGSKKYFDDIIVISEFRNEVLRIICMNIPDSGVADRFKELTYTDEAYERYRINIIKDFHDKDGVDIPDSVLYKSKFLR